MPPRLGPPNAQAIDCSRFADRVCSSRDGGSDKRRLVDGVSSREQSGDRARLYVHIRVEDERVSSTTRKCLAEEEVVARSEANVVKPVEDRSCQVCSFYAL